MEWNTTLRNDAVSFLLPRDTANNIGCSSNEWDRVGSGGGGVRWRAYICEEETPNIRCSSGVRRKEEGGGAQCAYIIYSCGRESV